MGCPEGRPRLTRCLLIDADILAYKSTSVHQKRYDWGEGVVSVVANFEAAKAQARETLDDLMETLAGDRFVICLSDDMDNFRKSIDPTYKSNRKGVARPQELYRLKEWLEETFTARRVPLLEADDVMGLMATNPKRREDRIIVSDDKDMKTVPALLYRPNEPKAGVQDISPEAAARFHLYQTIIGDQTDGYPGCPGAGPKEAEGLLAGVGWEPYVHTFKSGPRKGLEETRWRELAGLSPWRAIVSRYEKAGLREADALRQARLAFILRHGWYAENRIIPWVPREAN